MAIDLAKVRARLNALSTTNNKNVLLWKPKAGKSVIRILPYKFQPDNPFIELLFHYGINNKNYLSPATFGKPDPIVEFSNKLKTTGDKEDWKQGKKLEPKLRTYAAILVRGEEAEGVKFWGFGKTVYETLLGIIADEDYGDISDLKSGRDITVEFKEGDKTKNTFAETSIRVKPNITPVTEDKAILEKIKDQKDILTLFPESSYEDLQKALEAWLNPEQVDDPTVDAPVSTDESTPTDEEPATVGATASSSTAVEADFDKLFNS